MIYKLTLLGALSVLMSGCGGIQPTGGALVFTDGYVYCEGEIACGVVNALR